jgi:hypothetical protein
MKNKPNDNQSPTTCLKSAGNAPHVDKFDSCDSVMFWYREGGGVATNAVFVLPGLQIFAVSVHNNLIPIAMPKVHHL